MLALLFIPSRAKTVFSYHGTGLRLYARCSKYRKCNLQEISSQFTLKIYPLSYLFGMESYFCGPVTAEALPRKVRVVRTFFETFFFLFPEARKPLFSLEFVGHFVMGLPS